MNNVRLRLLSIQPPRKSCCITVVVFVLAIADVIAFHVQPPVGVSFCRRTTVVSRQPTFVDSSSQRISAIFSSYVSDQSDYSSNDRSDDDDDASSSNPYGTGQYLDEEDDGEEKQADTVELQPVPMSKNAGSRFVACLWDHELQDDHSDERNVMDWHDSRIALTEDHVMYCRKKNMYNETFNSDSMVDIPWSLQLLSSDIRRTIGGVMCLESKNLKNVQQVLSEEPIVKMLTGGDLSSIPLYRWRHIRDYTLRIDDGRDGYPCMCLALDDEPEKVGNLREEVFEDVLEYWIRSTRVIAAGPLHMLTEFKDDPSSKAVGDFILFNAQSREHAIQFVEEMPSALEGLYKSMRVHFYNRLDVTGKFVSEDPLRDAPCADLKEAMEVWGYPVADDQTPWLNW